MTKMGDIIGSYKTYAPAMTHFSARALNRHGLNAHVLNERVLNVHVLNASVRYAYVSSAGSVKWVIYLDALKHTHPR